MGVLNYQVKKCFRFAALKFCDLNAYEQTTSISLLCDYVVSSFSYFLFH